MKTMLVKFSSKGFFFEYKTVSRIVLKVKQIFTKNLVKITAFHFHQLIFVLFAFM